MIIHKKLSDGILLHISFSWEIKFVNIGLYYNGLKRHIEIRYPSFMGKYIIRS